MSYPIGYKGSYPSDYNGSYGSAGSPYIPPVTYNGEVVTHNGEEVTYG